MHSCSPVQGRSSKLHMMKAALSKQATRRFCSRFSSSKDSPPYLLIPIPISSLHLLIPIFPSSSPNPHLLAPISSSPSPHPHLLIPISSSPSPHRHFPIFPHRRPLVGPVCRPARRAYGHARPQVHRPGERRRRVLACDESNDMLQHIYGTC